MAERRRWVVRGAGVGVLIAAACGTADFTGGPPPPTGDAASPQPDGGPPVVTPGVDAGTPACSVGVLNDDDNCGACGVRCPGFQFCAMGRCATGCKSKAVYVSAATGSDDPSTTGCSPDKPFKTITAALKFVDQGTADGYEVRVCNGSYAEGPLFVDSRVSLLGSYDCSTGARAGFSTGPTFQAPLTAKLTMDPASTDRTRPVLRIGPSTIKVEGFEIDGPTFVSPDGGTPDAGATLANTAVRIEAGATVFASNDVRGGTGDGSQSSPAPILLHLAGGSPEIATNHLSGGMGGALSEGPVGILVDTGAKDPSIHDNAVAAGGGGSRKNGVALRIKAASIPTPLRGNVFRPTEAVSSLIDDFISADLGDSDVTFERNTFQSLPIGPCGASADSFAIRAGKGTLRLRQNRIETPCVAGAGSSSTGIHKAGGRLEMDSNIVKMGGAADGNAPGDLIAENAGGQALVIYAVGNTFVTDFANARIVAFGPNEWIGNMFVAPSGLIDASRAIRLIDNGFVSLKAINDVSITNAEAHGRGKDNFLLSTTCTIGTATDDASRCRAIATSGGSAFNFLRNQALSSSAPMDGLLDKAPCQFVSGGADTSAEPNALAVDILGVPRPTNRSLGAYENVNKGGCAK